MPLSRWCDAEVVIGKLRMEVGGEIDPKDVMNSQNCGLSFQRRTALHTKIPLSTVQRNSTPLLLEVQFEEEQERRAAVRILEGFEPRCWRSALSY